MSTQIFFAHSAGAQGGPGQGSYDLVEWLREALAEEYDIHCPIVEDPEAPAYARWQALFDRELAGRPGEIILIGHSLGASVLLKYLCESKPGLQIQGFFSIAAPYWGEDGWHVDDFAITGDVQKHLPELPAFHLYHCLDDPFVPIGHMGLYQQLFPHAIRHELSGSEHTFAAGLPELAEDIKNLDSPAT